MASGFTMLLSPKFACRRWDAGESRCPRVACRRVGAGRKLSPRVTYWRWDAGRRRTEFCYLEFQMEPVDVYSRSGVHRLLSVLPIVKLSLSTTRGVVEVTATCDDAVLCDVKVGSRGRTMAFGSGVHG